MHFKRAFGKMKLYLKVAGKIRKFIYITSIFSFMMLDLVEKFDSAKLIHVNLHNIIVFNNILKPSDDLPGKFC